MALSPYGWMIRGILAAVRHRSSKKRTSPGAGVEDYLPNGN